MSTRTSRLVIVTRLGLVGFIGGFLLFYLTGILGINWGFIPCMVGGIAGPLGLLLFSWTGVRVIGAVCYGHDPAYRKYIAKGGDPYFDGLPPPFNSDSWTQRIGGLREPVTDFIPPEHWRFQCPRCGARVEHGNSMCWNCGHGNDLSQCHGCGTIVREPSFGAFETTGVICPNCNSVIRN